MDARSVTSPEHTVNVASREVKSPNNCFTFDDLATLGSEILATPAGGVAGERADLVGRGSAVGGGGDEGVDDSDALGTSGADNEDGLGGHFENGEKSWLEELRRLREVRVKRC